MHPIRLTRIWGRDAAKTAAYARELAGRGLDVEAVADLEAAVRQAELNLDWTDVRAPLAGRISDRKVDAGNLIQGGQQGATLLATIVTVDPIRFVFDVSESDYLRYTRLFLSGAMASCSRAASPAARRRTS